MGQKYSMKKKRRPGDGLGMKREFYVSGWSTELVTGGERWNCELSSSSSDSLVQSSPLRLCTILKRPSPSTVRILRAGRLSGLVAFSKGNWTPILP